MTPNPQLGITQYQVYQIFKQTYMFLASGSFKRTVASFLFFYDFTNLRCAWYFASVDL